MTRSLFPLFTALGERQCPPMDGLPNPPDQKSRKLPKYLNKTMGCTGGATSSCCGSTPREPNRTVPELPSLSDVLIRHYGAVLPPAEIARLMGFKSTDALGQARRCGRVPVHMFRIPGRRGWHADTREVAAWLTQLSARLGRDAPMS
jgi:hypothetical protein